MKLPGERVRDFVLTDEQEPRYLENAPQPLKDAVVTLLDEGLRVGELLRLEWRDLILESVSPMPNGCLHIRFGKSQNAKRMLPLTCRVQTILGLRRPHSNRCPYVFTNETGDGPLSVYTLEDQHSRVRKELGLDGCTIHSFRHTCATRLGEGGASAVEIMHYLGHGSLSVSQRYVHSTTKLVSQAVLALERRKVGQSPCKVPVVDAPPKQLVAVSDL